MAPLLAFLACWLVCCLQLADAKTPKAPEEPTLTGEELVKVLVRDFLVVQSSLEEVEKVFDDSELFQRPATTWSVFDDSEFQRREKEVKDRYEALFQTVIRECERRGGPEPPPATRPFPAPDLEESLAAVDSELLSGLQRKRGRSFLATKADWKERLRPCLKGSPLNFMKIAASLRNQHQQLASLYDPTGASDDFREQNLVDPQQLPERTPELDKYFKIFNASYLPSHADLIEVFPWLSPDAVEPDHPDAAFSQDVALGDKLSYSTPLDWIFFFSNRLNKVCEVFTQEYVSGLSRYLAHRINTLLENKPDGEAVTVAEVGAGNGRLAHFLRQYLSEVEDLQGRYRVVATDILGNTGDLAQLFDVEKLDHQQTLRKFKPELVICSWMSMQVDLTEDFRRTKHVQEYILIGEVEYGVSGKPQETWGLNADGSEAQHVKEGFERIDLERLSSLQIARSDTPYVRFHSQTTIFRREPKRTVNPRVKPDEL